MAVTFDNIYDPDTHKLVEGYTFHDAQLLSNDAWSITISAYELARLWDEQKIVYYPSIQRGTTLKKQKNGEYKIVAVFNKGRVNKIQSLIMNGNYFPDQLTVNILNNKKNPSQIDYNEENRTLYIVKGLMCLSDGQHRTKACHNIYQNMKILGYQGKEIEEMLKNLKFQIKITNYDDKTAANYFAQLAEGEKISTSRKEYFNSTDPVSSIVRTLNSRGVLKNKINDSKTSISISDTQNVTTFSTLTTAIRNNFRRINDENEEQNITSFLQEFFSELFSIFPEFNSHQGRTESKKINLTCENFMFHAYVGLAGHLYTMNGKNWKNKLRKIENINMDKTSDLWEGIVRPVKNKPVVINNNTTRRMAKDVLISEFMKQLMD